MSVFNDIVIGSEKCEYTLGEEALELHANFFNAKSAECTILEENSDANEIIANLSKIQDQVLRVAVIFQIIQMSLEYLEENEDFPNNNFS